MLFESKYEEDLFYTGLKILEVGTGIYKGSLCYTWGL